MFEMFEMFCSVFLFLRLDIWQLHLQKIFFIEYSFMLLDIWLFYLTIYFINICLLDISRIIYFVQYFFCSFHLVFITFIIYKMLKRKLISEQWNTEKPFTEFSEQHQGYKGLSYYTTHINPRQVLSKDQMCYVIIKSYKNFQPGTFPEFTAYLTKKLVVKDIKLIEWTKDCLDLPGIELILPAIARTTSKVKEVGSKRRRKETAIS